MLEQSSYDAEMRVASMQRRSEDNEKWRLLPRNNPNGVCHREGLEYRLPLSLDANSRILLTVECSADDEEGWQTSFPIGN